MDKSDTTDDYRQTPSDQEQASEISPSSTSPDVSPTDEQSPSNFQSLHVRSVYFDKQTHSKTFDPPDRHPVRKRRFIFDEHVKVTRLKRSDLRQLTADTSMIRFNTNSRGKSTINNHHDELQQSKINVTRTSAKTGTTQESSQNFLFPKPIVTRISSSELLSASRIFRKDTHVIVTRVSRKSKFWSEVERV